MSVSDLILPVRHIVCGYVCAHAHARPYMLVGVGKVGKVHQKNARKLLDLLSYRVLQFVVLPLSYNFGAQFW